MRITMQLDLKTALVEDEETEENAEEEENEDSDKYE